MSLIIIWALFCIIPAIIASNKGRSGIGIFLLSLILSPLVGLIVALIMSSPQTPQTIVISQSQISQEIPTHNHHLEDEILALEKLGQLKEKGIISEQEFIQEKSKLFGNNQRNDRDLGSVDLNKMLILIWTLFIFS